MIVNSVLSSIVYLFPTNKPITSEPELSSVGLFPVTEENEKSILLYVALILSIATFIFAIFFKIKFESSLYSSVGLIFAFSSLVTWNANIALIYGFFAFVANWYVQGKQVSIRKF